MPANLAVFVRKPSIFPTCWSIDIFVQQTRNILVHNFSCT